MQADRWKDRRQRTPGDVIRVYKRDKKRALEREGESAKKHVTYGPTSHFKSRCNNAFYRLSTAN